MTGRNTQLTIANIMSRVKARLGHGRVEIELDDAMFSEMIQSALEEYSRHIPYRGYRKLNLTTGQTRYGPIETSHPGFLGVVRVNFLSTPGLSGETPFNINQPEPENPQFFVINGTAPGTYEQSLQFAEAAQQVSGGDPDWRGYWDQTDNHYYLFIDAGNLTECSYTFTAQYCIDVTAQNGMHMIPQGDTKWIIDYVSAQARLTLADVRGKYEGITGPDGSDQAIDWSKMREQGEQATERLMEEIERRRRPLPPVLG